MPVGNVTLTIKDGGLGILPSSTSQIQAKLGVCSLGTVNTLYSFSAIDDLVATLGTGPAVEAAAYTLSIAGGSVYVMPVNASVPGVSSSVTPTRVGTSTGTVSVSGTPLDAYSVIVKVSSSGTAQLVTTGNVGISISLDGGLTYGQQVFVPVSGTYVISGTGLTLAFSATTTTFDSVDLFVFTCQAPFYSSGDLNTAFAALFNDARTWGFVHVVGYPTAGSSAANATAAATIASTVSTQMATAAANFRYARSLTEAPPSLDADLITSYGSFADTRVRVDAGTCVLNSPINGRKLTRHWAWVVSARLGAVSISTSPGRVSDGPALGVVSINRDERKTPGLYDQRFGTSQTYIGLNGFYVDLGKTMASVGSDFTIVMNGRVMDVACTQTRLSLLQSLNASIRVNATTGLILESEAKGIEQFVERQVRDALGANCSDVTVTVNRTDNILSTQLLRVKTRVIPLGYAAAITEDIGFSNPALILA